MSYSLDWRSGAAAQIEIMAPGKGDKFQLKYTSPFRTTIRPPVEVLNLGSGALEPISDRCAQLEKSRGLPGARHVGLPAGAASIPAPAAAPSAELSEAEQLAYEIGTDLYTLLLPSEVQADLRTYGLHLEVGLDESLLGLPWELLHDGNDFLCLQHYVARFVNSATPLKAAPLKRPTMQDCFDPLRVLLVSVPQPQPRSEGQRFDSLPQAQAETRVVRDLLLGQEGIQLVEFSNENASFRNITEVLKQQTFQIIHFNGHAHFNEKDPFNSALMLHDKDMPTGWLQKFITRSAPVLCFMNACETAATGSGLYGLARAFLETGAYLIGSRWKISDTSAKTFAETFYRSAVFDQHPLGEAVTEARTKCREASPDLGWASYVYYGDPRVAFRQTCSRSA